MINLILLFPLIACLILFIFKNKFLNNLMINIYAVMHFIVSLAFCMGWDFLPMIKPCKFFAVDDTNKIFLMVMSIVFLAVAVYNNGYLKNDSSLTRKLRHYTYMVLFFVFSMTGAILSSNLGAAWVFIEGTTLASAYLIYFHKTKHSIEAAWKYVFICSIGIALAFVGIILLTMMVPFQIIMIPLYIEEYKFKILDTYLGLILPRASSAYGIFMLTSFFENIPKSLDEAARIDGMKEKQIYSRIILPLAKPAFITLGIYHFMNNWNDLIYPMMLTSSVEKRTLSAGLAILVGSNSIKYGPTLAATVISIAPLMILFLFCQRFFMEGIATSGMKE